MDGFYRISKMKLLKGGINLNSQYWETIIPSQCVRDYLDEIGHEFTDRELATMIYCLGFNCSMMRIHKMLNDLADQTADEQLKRDIREVIDFEQKEIAQVKQHIPNTVYMVELEEDNMENGFFFTYDAAEKWGKSLGERLKIIKYKIFTGTEAELDPKEKFVYSELGTVFYSEKGEILSCNSSEVEEETWDVIRDIYFREAYTKYPYPFKKGDIVRNVLDNSIGIVISDESPEGLRKRYEHLESWEHFLKAGFYDYGPNCDWFVDGKMLMGDPTEPRYLEYVSEEEFEKHPNKWEILQARMILQGGGSLAYLLSLYQKDK